MIERYSSELLTIDSAGRPTLDVNAVYEYLYNAGIRKYFQDGEKNSCFVKINGYCAEMISQEQLVDIVKDKLISDGVTQVTDIMKRGSTLFTDYMVRVGLHKVELQPVRDGMDYGMFVFRNCVVVVTANNITVVEKKPEDYFIGNQIVWKDDLIDRDFVLLKPEETSKAHFNEFLKCATGVRSQNQYGEERTVMMYRRLVKAIGYLLHTYKRPSMARAIVMMDHDSIIHERSMGGTGKGVIMKGISYMRPLCDIDGKKIDPKDKFVLQGVMPHHKVVLLNDVSKNFDFEMIFNWLTDVMSIENKYQAVVRLPFEVSPKVAILTNYIIKGLSDSVARRKYDVILYNFFNRSRSVEDYFGHMFYYDWDEDEWARFDNFMLYCLRYYLANRDMSEEIQNEEYKDIRAMYDVGEELFAFFLTIEKNKWLRTRDLYHYFTTQFTKTNAHISLNSFSRKLADFCMTRNYSLHKKIISGFQNICIADGKEDINTGIERSIPRASIGETPKVVDYSTQMRQRIGDDPGIDIVEPPF